MNETILLKNATIMDTRGHFNEKKDVFLRGGVIEKFADFIDLESELILDLEGQWLSPGFVDVHVHLRDPGFPEKETLQGGARAGLYGGFTNLVAMANTNPVMDRAEEIASFLSRAQDAEIHIYTVSALTVGLKGEMLVDMEKNVQAGAIGFSDDGFPLQDVALLTEAMERAKEMGVPLSFHEEDPSYVRNPGINAGAVAQEMGLVGAESYGEYSYIARDLALALKMGTKVDIQHISTKEGASLLHHFHGLGAEVLGEITPHHLLFTEEKIRTHGTLAKMNPPLRLEEDRTCLQKMVKYPEFAIATDHAPHTLIEKDQAFTKAPSGIIGLEVAFPLTYPLLVKNQGMDVRDYLESLTYIPATFYQLPYTGIREGVEADCIVIDPEEQWTVDGDTWKGTAKNSPYGGEEALGKVNKVFTKGKYHDLRAL